MTTDDAEAGTDATADTGDTIPETVPERLLLLQRIDTEADQLRHRREHLPEREQLATRTEQLSVWERDRERTRTRIDELTVAIESEEERGGELVADKQRLEAQLKTVISPREAEALMNEIAGVDARRDELDDQELADLTEQTTLEDRLASLLGDEPALRAAFSHADEALGRAVADIDAELAGLDERRTEAREGLDGGVLAQYEQVRSKLGVAVAKLDSRRCSGCHLDLSAAEVDTARDESTGIGYTECPQCGRMLVV
ncbi:MAG: zinc ribbon domain-containing protein [Ilumatobacteraceae bacterium]